MNIPPEWKKVFEQAGVTEEQLKDQSTAQFIFDFMASQGVPAQETNTSATLPRRSSENVQQSAIMTPMVPEVASPTRPVSTAQGGRRYVYESRLNFCFHIIFFLELLRLHHHRKFFDVLILNMSHASLVVLDEAELRHLLEGPHLLPAECLLLLQINQHPLPLRQSVSNKDPRLNTAPSHPQTTVQCRSPVFRPWITWTPLLR